MESHREVAFWRLSILGPLISARLEHGDRRMYFEEASRRWYQRPDGRFVRVSARTIEAWYHAYRRGGFEALVPRTRTDRGRSRAIDSELAATVREASPPTALASRDAEEDEEFWRLGRSGSSTGPLAA